MIYLTGNSRAYYCNTRITLYTPGKHTTQGPVLRVMRYSYDILSIKATCTYKIDMSSYVLRAVLKGYHVLPKIKNIFSPSHTHEKIK